MNEKIWTLSNFISLLRILSTIPIGILLWNDHNIYAFFLAFIGGAVTDNLDGYFARKFNQITEFGKIIDPLADKIFIGAIVVIMMIKGQIPSAFVIAILVRDLLILAAGVLLSSKIKSVPPSNIIGKATVTIVGLNIALFMLNFQPLADYSLWLSYFMMALSLVAYTMRSFRLIREQK